MCSWRCRCPGLRGRRGHGTGTAVLPWRARGAWPGWRCLRDDGIPVDGDDQRGAHEHGAVVVRSMEAGTAVQRGHGATAGWDRWRRSSPLHCSRG
uniref:Uncharacterized protein n=1 Tax=Arundo donax TaxID=35708 RepID=A0A0A8Z8M0_ARUDO